MVINTKVVPKMKTNYLMVKENTSAKKKELHMKGVLSMVC
jgi:hypothetical protein